MPSVSAVLGAVWKSMMASSLSCPPALATTTISYTAHAAVSSSTRLVRLEEVVLHVSPLCYPSAGVTNIHYQVW